MQPLPVFPGSLTKEYPEPRAKSMILLPGPDFIAGNELSGTGESVCPYTVYVLPSYAGKNVTVTVLRLCSEAPVMTMVMKILLIHEALKNRTGHWK